MIETSIMKELKRDSSTGVSAWVLFRVSEEHFYRAPIHLVPTQNFPKN